MHKPFRVLWAVGAFVLAGCASHLPKTRVDFPKASINGHPARLELDTGASSTVLFAAGRNLTPAPQFVLGGKDAPRTCRLEACATARVSSCPLRGAGQAAGFEIGRNIGMMRLSKGDQAGARDWFRKCRAAGINGDDEYHFAGAELGWLAGAVSTSRQSWH